MVFFRGVAHAHAPVDGSKPMCIWAALIGPSELYKKIKPKRTSSWGGGLRGVPGENRDKYHQNTVYACMKSSRNK